MAALPTVGGSTNVWGDELNAYLNVEHTAGGFHQSFAGPLAVAGKITSASLDITGITDGYVPYLGSGVLAASPLFTDGTNIGIGTTSPGQALDLVGSLELETTTSSTTGVIYKGTDRFIHTFSHPTGSTDIPAGFNTFIGIGAGNFTMGSTATSVNHGSYNVASGYRALYSNTTGSSNVASGYQTIYSNTTGSFNAASGSLALYANTTGSYNVASGYQTLYSNTTGSYNVASGYQTLFSNTEGNNNTASGYSALYSNTTGSSNTASGSRALYSNIEGNNNTASGYNAGRYIAGGSTPNETSNNSLFLGYDTRANADGETNQIVIGASAIGNGSNSATLGNSSITKTVLRGNVGIDTTTPDYKCHVNGTFGCAQAHR